MQEQKRDIIAFVQDQKVKGQSITESLKALGIKRSTSCSWVSPREEKKTRRNIRELTPFEQKVIDETKERYPIFVTDKSRGCFKVKVSIFP